MRRLLGLMLVGLACAACGGDSGGESLAGDAPDVGGALAGDVASGGETSGDVDDGITPPPVRPPTGQLSAVEPGGDTICSRGDAYRFYVYGGDPSRVVIDFQGGGACWNDWTCSIADAIFSDSPGTLAELESYREMGMLGGIYDFDDPDNPFHGWTLVHVPYCTGDIHWGDATVNYADDLTIHHRGARNVQAVMAWLQETYPDAEQLVSTGCSAGAYGAIGHAPALAELYPDARLTVIADAGAGVITDSFLAESFPNWNAEASMPMHLDGLAGADIQELRLVDFYVAVASAYPEMRVAQHTAAYDKDQIFYFTAMGGDEADWQPKAAESLAEIRGAVDNFRYYLSPGPIHCIHPYDITYTREVGGVAYHDWVRDLVSGDAIPDDVICEGDCRDDPICAGCADDSLESMACHWCDDWEP